MNQFRYYLTVIDWLQTSFLYSVFAGDAEKLCTSIHTSDCLKGTLKYGLDKLKELSDEDLDDLDPYQRDGNNLSKLLQLIQYQLIN